MSISKGKNRNTAWFAAIDKEWGDLRKAYKVYFDKSNFHYGNQIKSLSSLTEKILYKKDNLEFTNKN